MKPTALITGASGGIGYELAKLFAKSGYALIVVARSEDKLQQLKEELKGHSVTIIVQDLSKPGAAEALYNKVREQGRTVEVLVNNAGFGLNGLFDEILLRDQQAMMQVNIQTLTELTHYFLPDMKNTRMNGVPRGVLNVSSVAAFQPGPRMAVYYASKAYVLSFSEALVEELKGTGVTVTTLCPGATETKFFETANAQDTKLTDRMMSPKQVANEGFVGFIKGKRVVIPGKMNRSMAIATKFMSRSAAAKVAHYMDK
ncbi:SDR family oxidoreductase [Halobacillus sp. Marseille-Q1614]|uniref:SDR family NAD(P)-dependent oxidoreductase n=1 Tax=Halobacillus sp. Marseille-Q1614 TaxID=2709134 RepID=UPI00156D8237|nr:SDR family oxidoreductase [Halobacillus sp. Marseille-Q1614]